MFPARLSSAVDRLQSRTDDVRIRASALVLTLVLTGAFVGVLYRIADVAGDTVPLLGVVAAAFLIGTVGAKFVAVRTAVSAAAVGLVGGLVLYVSTVPGVSLSGRSALTLAREAYPLFTGYSLVQILNADVWAASVAPVPVSLTWYLSLRHRYATSAWVGLLTVGFFTLTGDAGQVTTLVGTVSSLGLLGLDSLERVDLSGSQLAELGLLLAIVVVATRFVDVMPGAVSASASGESPGSVGDGTLEGSLMNAGDQLPVLGSISLSSTARFTISAPEEEYWSAGTYDRYTGRGWVRTGAANGDEGSLRSPPESSSTFEQRVEVESAVQTMPAAWRPVTIPNSPSTPVSVTSFGSLRPNRPFQTGESYVVRSERPAWTPDRLREAGLDYPDSIRTRYLQLPNSTPDRLSARTREIAADSDTAYDAANAVRDWLRRNKSYSLDVERPDGDVADAFVFEMDRGYCVYYATAMVAMLRSVGIPARFSVGYTPGERVDEERWLVRGFDSHAWVDVFFPNVGWVRYDPTPAGPRREAGRSRLEEARATGESNVDTEQTKEQSSTETPEAVTSDRTEESETGTETRESATNPDENAGTPTLAQTPSTVGPAGGDGSRDRFDAPNVLSDDRDRLTALAGAAGIVLGVYRVGLLNRLQRWIRIRRQVPTENPREDVRRAFRRLELSFENRYRARRTGETQREYLRSVGATDPRVRRVSELYERTQYGPGVSRSGADEAIELVDQIVAGRSDRIEEER